MVNSAISSDIRRALSGAGFLIATAGMVLAVVLAGLQSIFASTQGGVALPNGFHAQLVLTALTSDWVTLALPVLCALPYSTSFVDDIKSGYIKQYLHRTSVGQYIKGKLIACGLSGGLVLFAGVVLAYGLSALVFTPMEFAPGPGEATQPYFAELLMQAAVLFFSGAFWSLAGFTFAALTMNKFMAYASPFILYYLLIILHERYFEDLYVLYPKEWLSPSTTWVMGSWGVILLLLELMALAGLTFAVAARRRLANV
jgi:hypothetical protein